MKSKYAPKAQTIEIEKIPEIINSEDDEDADDLDYDPLQEEEDEEEEKNSDRMSTTNIEEEDIPMDELEGLHKDQQNEELREDSNLGTEDNNKSSNTQVMKSKTMAQVYFELCGAEANSKAAKDPVIPIEIPDLSPI